MTKSIILSSWLLLANVSTPVSSNVLLNSISNQKKKFISIRMLKVKYDNFLIKIFLRRDIKWNKWIKNGKKMKKFKNRIKNAIKNINIFSFNSVTFLVLKKI